MMMHLLAESNPLDHVVDWPILQRHGWWLVTNHVVMLLLAGALMLLIFPIITRPYRDGKHVPTGARNFFEAIMMYMRNDVVKPVLGHRTDDYMPYIWTLFFFILFVNVIGLLPLDIATGPAGLGWGHHGHGVFGTATSNFYVTGTLAMIAFSVFQYTGIKNLGFSGWARHFLGGAPAYLALIMIPVEILGMMVKPFSLAVRLAANMTAGHTLLAVIISFVAMATAAMGNLGGFAVGIPAVLGAVAIMCLELFVAVLQAYLFTFLTTLFIGQMASHHEHPDEHHGEQELDTPGHEDQVAAHAHAHPH
jgi:F-type H+-transporting ATPase subunit a